MESPFKIARGALGAKNTTQRFENLKTAAARARLPFDKDVYLNVAFYLDEQYVEWASDANTIRAIPRLDDEQHIPRPVSNKIMHFCATEHAMAMQDQPTVDVLPSTSDPIDASEASVSLAYLKWLADPQVADFEGELSDSVNWALVGNEGFLKWTFNAKEGRGDIMSCSPLDIYPDPYARTFRKCRWVIHSQFMDVEQVYDLYGKEVEADTTQNADDMRTRLLRDMGQAPVLYGAIVNELWLKPCRRYPDGLFVVWAGKEILYGPSKFPYEHGHLPFTQIGTIQRPGSLHYASAVKYLRNPQMELNKYHAQRIMIREAYAAPKWWLPPGLELEVDPDDSPRQILRGKGTLDPSLKPEIIQGAAIQAGDEGAWIAAEMMDTVGIHEVSQGGVPGRVESSRAIENLQNTDANRLAELRRTIKAAIAEGFWQQLQLAKQYVREDLLVSTYSRDGLQEVRKFKGAMVQPGFKVRVTMQTGLMGSRAAKEERILTWFQAGIITDPAVMADLLEIPVSVISPFHAQDIIVARNENLTMGEGQAIMPNTWDDHDTHIREHDAARKGAAYQSMSTTAKQIFEFHVSYHKEMRIANLQEAAMVQMAAQGMMPPPDGGGAAGPPGDNAQDAPTSAEASAGGNAAAEAGSADSPDPAQSSATL